jgi:release factor glutamine methyltransferase
MTRILHFVQGHEVRDYSIQDRVFSLELNERVFPPSPHGVFFAKNMTIGKGESVIDVGTGSGFLAILAAKLGGVVSATDVDPDAIELAKKNAVLNGVDVDFCTGSYFADACEKFDVILANLPQDIVHKDYLDAIGAQRARSFDGGRNGNGRILAFLDTAHRYMHSRSRIYLIVYSVTHYVQTLKKMISHYRSRLVAVDAAPTKEYVEDNIEWYRDLNEAGDVSMFHRHGQWHAYEFLFELTLT